MNVFVPYLAALHQQDLLEEARLRRRASLSRSANTGVPAWRRSLSGVLHSAAQSLDPSVDAERESRRSRDGGVGRAFAS